MTMTRLEMVQWIVNAEARRDKQKRLRVYRLKPADGGGSYEVAGLNDGYHPTEAAHAAELVRRGAYEAAEIYVRDYIAGYTDVVMRWARVPAIEFFLRDCCWNRGPKGALRILQLAVGVADDGRFGPITKTAVDEALSNPPALVTKLRKARERYERKIAPPVGKRAEFWAGLMNRFNNAEQQARALL